MRLNLDKYSTPTLIAVNSDKNEIKMQIGKRISFLESRRGDWIASPHAIPPEVRAH
jgi:hypothetical protein